MTAFVGTALAENFQGSTSEGSYARVKTNEFDRPELFVIRWRTECSMNGVFYRAKNAFAGPFRRQGLKHFRDFSRARNDELGEGFTSVVTTQYKGRRTFRNRWSGTFSAWVTVRQNGDFYTRCRTGEIRWTTVRD